MTTIAVLGAGKIGEALLVGLLAGGRSPAELMFTERHPERATHLEQLYGCLLYTSPSPRDRTRSRMPSSA